MAQILEWGRKRMARSFGLVDDKLFEAAFFLDKLAQADSDWFAARCYLSAFISAGRSVTFAIQSCLSDHDGFAEWYAQKQEVLRTNSTARFFGKARTESQHFGENLLNAGSFGLRQDGTRAFLYYFQPSAIESTLPDCPEVDAVSACREYIVLLVGIVFDCYERFGSSIDPALYYTAEHTRKLGLTVEDIEASFGFPRGWTRIAPGHDYDEQRLKMISREAGATAIDELFAKYLNRSR